MSDRIPVFLKPLAYEFSRRFLERATENKLRQEVENVIGQWSRIMKNSKDILAQIDFKKGGKNILFVTGYGVGTHFITLEPILMLSLWVRGCKVSSLFCDGALPACEFNITGNNCPKVGNRWKKGITRESILYVCNKCKKNVKAAYSILPVELHPYRNFIVPDDLKIADDLSRNIGFSSFRDWEYEGIRVGEEAFASVLRVTFRGVIEDTSYNRALVRRYLYSGIIMTRMLTRAYDVLKPDRVVVIHGVYLTHGLAARVANNKNIPVIVVGGGGIRKDTAMICHKETYHRQLVNEPNSLWEGYVLSDQQKHRVIDYAFKKRNAGHGVDYVCYHPDPIEDSEAIYRELDIDRSRPIVSLYTNVIWDAQILYSSNVFSDIFDWLFTSIDEMGKNKKIWLVIRIHPAESKGAFPTKQPMLPAIKKRYPNLPDNIRIIPPESNISSYTLAQESRAAIIYGTKMGLEIALMNVPLIICGETFSRGKGYGLDITSRRQYLEIMRDIQNYPPMTKECYERALKYAHYFYFRRMVDLPFTTHNAKDAGGGKTINLSSLAELLPHKSKEIDLICSGILDLSPFYFKE